MLNTRQQIRIETDLAELAKHEIRFMTGCAMTKICHGDKNWESESLMKEAQDRIESVLHENTIKRQNTKTIYTH